MKKKISLPPSLPTSTCLCGFHYPLPLIRTIQTRHNTTPVLFYLFPCISVPSVYSIPCLISFHTPCNLLSSLLSSHSMTSHFLLCIPSILSQSLSISNLSFRDWRTEFLPSFQLHSRSQHHNTPLLYLVLEFFLDAFYIWSPTP